MASFDFSGVGSGTTLAALSAVFAGVPADLVVQSGGLQPASGKEWAYNRVTYPNAQGLAQRSEAAFVAGTQYAGRGLFVRGSTAGSTGYMAYFSGASIELRKDGAYLSAASAGLDITTTGCTVSIECDASASAPTLVVRVNGAALITYTDSASPLASGDPGFWLGGDGTASAARITSWTDGVAAGPAITVQPRTQAALVGEGATLSLTAAGSGLTYQWQQSTGGAFADVPAATSASLTLSALELSAHGTLYRCIVSDGSASTTSAVVQVLVYAAQRLHLADDGLALNDLTGQDPVDDLAAAVLLDVPSSAGAMVDLAGAATVLGSAAAQLALAQVLQGAATGSAQAGGAVSLSISLQGAAVAAVGASGALLRGVALASSAVVGAVAGAEMSLAVGLSGDAVAQALAAGTITHAVRMAAAATGGAQATGTLSTSASASLGGAAVGAALAQAALVLDVRLTGAALASVGGSAVLTYVVPLTGAALASAQAQGSLALAVVLQASANASAQAAGALSAHLVLQGEATGSAQAQAALEVAQALAAYGPARIGEALQAVIVRRVARALADAAQQLAGIAPPVARVGQVQQQAAARIGKTPAP